MKILKTTIASAILFAVVLGLTMTPARFVLGQNGTLEATSQAVPSDEMTASPEAISQVKTPSDITATPEATSQMETPSETTGAPEATSQVENTAESTVPFTPTSTPIMSTGTEIGPVATSNVPAPLVAQEFTLSSLRVRDFELVSPLSSAQFNVRIPNNWELDGTSSLNLNLKYFRSGTNQAIDLSTVQVQLDDQLIRTLSLPKGDTGEQTFTIPLDNNVLNSPVRRSHNVRVSLIARNECLLNQTLQLLMHSDMSYFHFEYRQAAPVLDLSQFPRPFYNSLIAGQRESALIVLPANFTPSDLETAASVAATLGQSTSDSLQLRTISAEQLAEQDMDSENLLFIGQAGSNSAIDQLYQGNMLPTQLQPDGTLAVRGQAIAADDGILQLIANPRNPLRSILVVTGKTDQAVKKAAQALSSSAPLASTLKGNLALISDVQPPDPMAFQEQRTLASLGYSDTLVSGVGIHAVALQFSVPAGLTTTNDASIDLDLNYADILRQAQTILTVQLNGTPLQSVGLGTANGGTDSTVETLNPKTNHIHASIPPTSLIPGVNTLLVTLDAQGDWKCFPPDEASAWLSISSTSALNIPRAPINLAIIRPSVSWFPAPFTEARDLHTLLMILPDKPSLTDLDETIQLVERVGSETLNGAAFAPRIIAGQLPAGLDLAKYNVIVVGLPSTNSFLAQLNSNLPQPFVAQSNELKQVIGNATYRLPPGFDIGVLEALKSPWSPEHGVLVITGTAPQGQTKAMNVLVSLNYDRTQLLGDVVFAASNNVSVVDTTISEPLSLLETQVPGLTTEAAQLGSATPTRSPAQTVTPGPTATPSPAVSGSTTPLFTATLPTETVTPLPTFVPLPPNQIQPDPITTPAWIFGLIGATLVITVFSIIFALIRARQTRPKDQ